MNNNFSPSEIKFTPRAKPIIKVRVNPSNSNSNSKAAEAELILEAIARLNRSVVILEASLSEFLRDQKSEKIRRREARW
jgi:archaellum biogenesis ATPase FlaH